MLERLAIYGPPILMVILLVGGWLYAVRSRSKVLTKASPAPPVNAYRTLDFIPSASPDDYLVRMEGLRRESEARRRRTARTRR